MRTNLHRLLACSTEYPAAARTFRRPTPTWLCLRIACGNPEETRR